MKIGPVDPEIMVSKKSLKNKEVKKLMQAEHIPAGQACRVG